MKSFGVKAIVACCVLSLVALTHTLDGSAAAQENAESPTPKMMPKKRAEKPKTATKKKPKARKKAGGRLPAYYGQIELSDEQREKIYGIQRGYREQIQELRKQLQALEAKQKEEINEVLTEEQKAKLTELVDNAKKKRSTPPKKKSGA